MTALWPDVFNKVYEPLKERSVSDTQSLTAVSSLPCVPEVFLSAFHHQNHFSSRKKESRMEEACGEATNGGNRLPLRLVNFFKFSLEFIYLFLLGTST